jgi:hypothetical protein
MNESPRRLQDIQLWMQAVIAHPGGIEHGIASADARERIDVDEASVEDVILRSNALSAVERLRVYGNAYYSRLIQCLREFFPALVHALGEELFDDFAFGYLQAYPSRSYTLARLPYRFVDYLAESRDEMHTEVAQGASPVDGEEQVLQTHWSDFVIDLARLEWAIDQVFDGPGVEGDKLLTVEQLRAIPTEQWPTIRLVPVVCLRLLSFKYPVNDYYSRFRQDQKPSPPAPQETYLALTRRQYVVRRHPLTRPQFELLTALQNGSTLETAIAAAADCADDLDQLANQLQSWFQHWASADLFASVAAEQ